MADSDESAPGFRDAARAQILDAAAVVFQAQGFERTTIDDIAERIGATKGRIYYYFRSKFDIYLAVYEAGMSGAFLTVEPLSQEPGTGRERLTAMAVRHLVNLMTDPGYHDVISQGVVAGRSTALKEHQRQALIGLNEVRTRYEDLFRGVVTDGMADGSLRAGDARLATRFLLSSLNSTAMWFRVRENQDAAEIRDLAEQIVDQAIGGLAS
ncbi:TetR/AcrR family transcriptional regulator [Corynebacterium variabile]|uniref:TetR family transcriptional regulator n=1 Tax=Corynebacterium variabile TaxID=1727 RepID=A0A3C0MPG8_9CORY|nr:TetR/AcrR family transcriptional regulator [Corynebacterium variabile]MDN6241036.1 TetR/AcrR family transcriptional regulator [Corynebacterium variabile]MDN6477273.1 TetR/AcrR family transcriptional regulator [Corynebacterium variabile]MDN6618279.1 TetR/AcrR family transcriptional regulator [Corynebacterium variabile]MDN6661296.1 TetR/AcrR family transcriptional regulator [Corynebacterium variabile]MDN6676364.1 TetR/AcrR family transcriptional regulator [Corynebacterium variabile]